MSPGNGWLWGVGFFLFFGGETFSLPGMLYVYKIPDILGTALTPTRFTS